MRTWPALEIAAALPGAHPTETFDLLPAALLDYRVSAVEETSATAWRVHFAAAGDRDAAAAALAAQFPDLTIQPLDLPDEDWAARSQASLRAVHVGRLIVAPPWDVAHRRQASDGAPTTIVIQPSMGFGTGHHATTRLCLAALQQLDLSGLRVIDVGTGSGVLAIAASRLGAGAVVGIDDDQDALDAAAENVALNEGAAVTLQRRDIQSGQPGPFDLVVANLTGALLIRVANRLQGLAAPSGWLVVSGLLAREEDAVRSAFAALAIRHRTEEDEWVCLTLQRL